MLEDVLPLLKLRNDEPLYEDILAKVKEEKSLIGRLISNQYRRTIVKKNLFIPIKKDILPYLKPDENIFDEILCFIINNENRLPVPKTENNEWSLYFKLLHLSDAERKNLKSFAENTETYNIEFVSDWILENERMPITYLGKNKEIKTPEDGISVIFRSQEKKIRERIKEKSSVFTIDSTTNTKIRKEKNINNLRNFISKNNRLPFSFEKDSQSKKAYSRLNRLRLEDVESYTALANEFPHAFKNKYDHIQSKTKLGRVLNYLDEVKIFPCAKKDTTIRNYMFTFKRLNGKEYQIIKLKLLDLGINEVY